MKKTIIILTLMLTVISSIFFGGCIRKDISDETGNFITREFDFTDFTRIEVSNTFVADIARSDSYSITVVISEKAAERLKVVKNGDTLEVGLKEPFWNFWGISKSPEVSITLPALDGLKFSGASKGNIKGFSSSNDLDIDVSGASNLDIDVEADGFFAVVSGASGVSGYLKAQHSDFDISGASRMKLTGSGGNARLDVSGASQAQLEDFALTDADVEFSGASNGKIEVSGRLDADVSGASTLEYAGSPILGKLDISGGSSIKPR